MKRIVRDLKPELDEMNKYANNAFHEMEKSLDSMNKVLEKAKISRKGNEKSPTSDCQVCYK